MKIGSKAKRGGTESPQSVPLEPSTVTTKETAQSVISHNLQSPAKRGAGGGGTDTHLTEPTLGNTLSRSLAVMDGPTAGTQRVKPSTSPTHGRSLSGVGHGNQDSVHTGHQSPVQLTELVSPEAQKAFHPASDKNHNFAPPYVVSHCEMLQYPYSGTEAGSESKTFDHSGMSDDTAAKTGLYPGVYYSAMYGGDVSNMYEHSVYPCSLGSYVYQREGQYQQQYTFPDGSCKNYSFSSLDTGREYSSPELAYSSGSTHTPPLNNSNSSMGESPGSSHLSPDGRSFSAGKDSFMASGSTGNVNKGQPADIGQDSRHCLPWNSSSVRNSYYSDEQSLEGDSIRDIEQDILQSDIEKHIYENYSQNLKIYTPDDDSFDDPEDLSPVQDLSPRRSSTGSKKRRRRTQTPIQRRAANMRERKRMCHLNLAFNGLKDRLPNVRNRKKLSRIQTLRAAIFYISLLNECIQSS